MLGSSTHVEGNLDGVGGLSLYWQGWLPAGEALAVVAIAHGVSEHGGRHAHVAERMTGAGFAVYALDHRGHGRSDGARMSVGRLAYVVADLDALILLAGERHPGAQRFLLGHSMGGAIALAYALEHQDRLAGLILSAPAVDVSAVSPKQLRIARLLSAVAPGVGMLKVDSGDVSRDPEVVRAYDEDPLVHRGRIPVRSIVEVMTAAQGFPARLGELQLPLLIVHGTADTLVAPAGSRLVREAAGSGDKTLELYEGLYHEVLNEPEKDAVIDDLVLWLRERS